MSNDWNSPTGFSQPAAYQIRLEGHLDPQWADWFDGLTITLEDDGSTLLTGLVADQAALHGLLKYFRILGIGLVSVNRRQLEETCPDRTTKEIKMDPSANPSIKIDPRVLLSTLWIVVMINMLKADILTLYIPGSAAELAQTSASNSTPIPQLMLGGAILMEISTVMILLSRILKSGVNRWVNMMASFLTIVFVVAGGVSYPHYLFIAGVEVICLLLIFWIAWKWRSHEGRLGTQPAGAH